MVKHFFFNSFDAEIVPMKKYFFFLICCSLLNTSCGEDNNDFILPEDIVNIDLDIGITFGEVRSNCTSDCFDVYRWSTAGLFVAENTAVNSDNSTTFSFSRCPISEQTRFVSQVEGIPSLPRGLRDIQSTNLNETINQRESATSIYIIEYTLNSGELKTIQFFNGINESEQISIYLNYIINTTQALDSLDTTPVECPL